MRLLEILDHRLCGATQDEPPVLGQSKPAIPAKPELELL